VIVAVLAVLFVINHFFIQHSLWDWIKLLIVPAVLAVGGVWFNQRQQARDRVSADRRAQDDALEAYLDDMTNLMIDHHLRSPPQGEDPKDIRAVARARTLTLLTRLDGERKGHVVQFLYESGLIYRYRIVVSLHGADLSRARLSGATLGGVDLSGARLVDAHLEGASLDDSIREGESLMNDPPGMVYKGPAINLENAILRGAHLEGANLLNAHLCKADLEGTYLEGTDLRGADLSEAKGWTAEQLSAAKSLEGATMPNGQKYEDWLKSRDSGKDR